MSEKNEILLINRDKGFLEAMAEFLRRAGFKVHTALEMHEALFVNQQTIGDVDVVVAAEASPEAVILVVAGLYFLAALFCYTLPASPPARSPAAVMVKVNKSEQFA